MRFDLQLIASLIEPGSKVLDLGCGHGTLLRILKEEKGVRGTGIEIYEDKVAEGIRRGLTVVHGDMNVEVRDYPDDAFDYVVLSQALMQVLDPAGLIREMLRVGKKGIVSFPNFAHWKNRLQLLFQGRAPVSKELPYEWFDTPNIRVITLRDFRRFMAIQGLPIERELAIRTHHHQDTGKMVTFRPELRASYGIFLLGRPHGGPKA